MAKTFFKGKKALKPVSRRRVQKITSSSSKKSGGSSANLNKQARSTTVKAPRQNLENQPNTGFSSAQSKSAKIITSRMVRAVPELREDGQLDLPDEHDFASLKQFEVPTNSSSHTSQDQAETESEDTHEAELAEIKRMISSTTSKLHALHIDQKADQDLLTEEPEVYDGISSEEERLTLLEAELLTAQKRSLKLKHEMELMRAEMEQEKNDLLKQLRNLRSDMHRQAPIQETKFFSISQDLQQALKEMEGLANQTEVITSPSPTPTTTVTVMQADTLSASPSSNAAVQSTPPTTKPLEQAATTTQVSTVQSSIPTQQAQESKPHQEGGKKKMMITGAVAVVLILLLGGGVTFSIVAKPTVSDQLVEEYLQKAEASGEVAGTTDAAPRIINTVEASPTATDEATSAGLNEAKEIRWETIDDTNIGFKVDYPQNAVRVQRTDSSVTFSIADGYIFRIQSVDTDLTLEEYWEKLQATSQSYTVEVTELRGLEAFHLILDEEAEYPGNKYLVNAGPGRIVDVWYATEALNYTQDDIQRAQDMLRSLVIKRVE